MNGQQILIVEDDKLLRAALHDILEDEGFTVQPAADGVEALRMMEEACPDLIVTDIMMPHMDGYGLYAAVRARPDWIAVPFIFLTSMAKSDVLKSEDLGAEDYIAKPFDPQELVAIIRARLKRAQAIRQATEAEFDRLKQQIVNALGHELRTPLTTILGYADLALEEIPSLPPEALRQYLSAIKRGADRLVRLADDFMAMVRLESGQAAKEFDQSAQVCGDVKTIVERTARQYEPRASARGVTLESRVEPGLYPVKLCEPLLANALERLVDNAIKFSPGEGKRVTVSGRAAGKWVEIAVADEGIGVPPDEMSRLFEGFRQIGRERLEQQGTGLGLTIAHELIRLHGGEIAVESRPNAGSTFTIRLPAFEG